MNTKLGWWQKRLPSRQLLCSQRRFSRPRLKQRLLSQQRFSRLRLRSACLALTRSALLFEEYNLKREYCWSDPQGTSRLNIFLLPTLLLAQDEPIAVLD